MPYLWVGNRDSNSLTVLHGVFNRSGSGGPGGPSTSGLSHNFDRAYYHYMANMSGLAFGAHGALLTCQAGRCNLHPVQAPGFSACD